MRQRNLRQRFDDIGTPSQCWARLHGACLGGRVRLGMRSIGEYWNLPTANPYDLLWIARRCNCDESRERVYQDRLEGCIVEGRWGTLHTRRALMAVMTEFGATLPAVLL